MSTPSVTIPAASPISTLVKVTSPGGGIASPNNPGNNCDLGEIFAEGSATGTGTFQEVWAKSYAATDPAIPVAGATTPPPMVGANAAVPGTITASTSTGGSWQVFVQNVDSDAAFPASPTAQNMLVVWTKFAGDSGVYTNTQVSVLGQSASATGFQTYSGFWQFNEGGVSATAADVSANANTLNVSNPAAMWQTTSAPVKPGLTLNYISFDGATNSCSAATMTGLPSGVMPRTVAFWFNIPVAPIPPNVGPCVSFGNVRGRVFIVTLVTSGANYYLLTDGLNPGNNVFIPIANFPAVNPGTWYHFALTFDPTTVPNWNFYFNGAVVPSPAGSGCPASPPYNTNTNAFQTGVRFDQPAGPIFYQSSLKDLRVYNFALTAAEVAALNPARSIELSPPSLLA